MKSSRVDSTSRSVMIRTPLGCSDLRMRRRPRNHGAWPIASTSFHEAVPGAAAMKFAALTSRYFYWDDIARRRLRQDVVHSASAKQAAQSLAQREQDALDFGK